MHYSKITKKSFQVFEKRDLEGNLISSKKLAIPSTVTWTPNNIIQTSDHNFLLTSTTYYHREDVNYHLDLVKLNQNGELIWTNKRNVIEPKQTLVKSNGDLIIYGNIYDTCKKCKTFLQSSLKVISLDKNGNLLWEKNIHDSENLEACSVAETKDYSLIFSSTINPKDRMQRAYIFEIDSLGKTIYGKSIDTNPTLQGSLTLPNSNKITLSITNYTPNWSEAHNGAIQFLNLIKN